MLRTLTSPAVNLGRGSTRGLGTVVAPSRAHVVSFYNRNGGLPLPPQPPSNLAPDSGRGFSCAFPSAGAYTINGLRGGFHSQLYALRIQSASKASIPRDPERPKRPLTAFFRFGAELREKQGVKKASEIGQAWKALGQAEKQPFEQAAASDMAAYKQKFEEYKASGKLDAFKRDPAKPKKPLTPFFAWAQQERKSPQFLKLPVSEAAKSLGSSWAAVPAASKAPLQADFQSAMQQYNAQMKTYKESGAETAWLESTGRLEIVKKAEAKKQAEKDKKMEAKAKKKAKEAKAKEKTKAAAAKDKEKARVKREKVKAAAAKDKEKARLRREKMKAAKAQMAAKRKTKLASERKKASAAKATAALRKKKAKAELDKKRAKAALDEKKKKQAKDAKKKAKLATDKAQKAKAMKAKKAKSAKLATDKAQKAKAMKAKKAKSAKAAKSKA